MYRVPKEKALILVRIPPAPPEWKTVFISTCAEAHQGQETISDLISASRSFLPLLGDGDGISLVRRDAVRWIQIQEPERFEWYYYEVRAGAPEATARVTFPDGEVIEGKVFAVGPAGEQRVQDLVNREKDFLHLESPAGLFLLNLKHVSTITVREEGHGGS